MCFAPYNLQEIAEKSMNLLSESMELVFDLKSSLPEGTYIEMCDELKKSYEQCDKLSHPETFGRPFCDWELEAQKRVKNLLAKIHDDWGPLCQLMEHSLKEQHALSCTLLTL